MDQMDHRIMDHQTDNLIGTWNMDRRAISLIYRGGSGGMQKSTPMDLKLHQSPMSWIASSFLKQPYVSRFPTLVVMILLTILLVSKRRPYIIWTSHFLKFNTEAVYDHLRSSRARVIIQPHLTLPESQSDDNLDARAVFVWRRIDACWDQHLLAFKVL